MRATHARRLVSSFRETHRFREPLHVSEDSNSDLLLLLILREVRLFQEVDIGSSTEIAVRAGLTQMSSHGENRYVSPPVGRPDRPPFEAW